ncbi:hypothetical protein KQI61_15450 [Anaerocolumna aminovalerica]|uniref:hypothetical protein n=1 Tax=Anaerocolumna aminovalerica TaxID=1527 RepID=UPI001C0ED84A|nr:hypothetical protein [Anaerocolumna aminovalerica]MBU5333594.1 hypothetical protein [Anaerocolumna aminovalerica]
MKLFCKHVDLKENRKYGNPDYLFGGYVFQCPKCGAYVGYSQEHNKYIKLSKKSFTEYIDTFCYKKGTM